MTPQEANKHIEEIMKKGEKAFNEQMEVAPKQFSYDRAPFLLGFLQAAFREHLIESNKIVLS